MELAGSHWFCRSLKGLREQGMQKCRRRTFQTVGTANAKVLGRSLPGEKACVVEHCELGAGVV